MKKNNHLNKHKSKEIINKKLEILYLGVAGRGFLMGIAEIVPGISGSTIALMTGIYNQFIGILFATSELIRVFLLFIIRKKKLDDVFASLSKFPWRFTITLTLGMVTGVLLFAKTIHYLLNHEPAYLYATIFGLLLATLIVPWKQMTYKGQSEILVFAITATILFTISGGAVDHKIMDPSAWYLFFVGVIAMGAMILPGVSGSFIMLLFGIYEYVVGLVANVADLSASKADLLAMGVFFIGMITGFVILSRVVKKALHSNQNILMAFILGLLIGSLRILWPFPYMNTNTMPVVVIGLMLFSTIGFTWLNLRIKQS